MFTLHANLVAIRGPLLPGTLAQFLSLLPFPILEGKNSQQRLSNLSPESPGGLVQTQIAGPTPRVSDPVGLGWCCTSNRPHFWKVPGNADAAGLWVTIWEPLIYISDREIGLILRTLLIYQRKVRHVSTDSMQRREEIVLLGGRTQT